MWKFLIHEKTTRVKEMYTAENKQRKVYGKILTIGGGSWDLEIRGKCTTIRDIMQYIYISSMRPDWAESKSLGWMIIMFRMIPCYILAGFSCVRTWRNKIVTTLKKKLCKNQCNFYVILTLFSYLQIRIRANCVSEFQAMEGPLHNTN